MRFCKLLRTLCLLALFFTSCTGAGRPTVTTPLSHPDIVFIVADDLDQTLGTMDYMPNLQKLIVKQGLTLSDFFVTDSECCPSRSTILRSQYTHSHQIFTNKPPSGSFEKFSARGLEESTVATWLQTAGYKTVEMGKYLNAYPTAADPTHIPPGWTEWYGLYYNKQSQYVNYQLVENGELVTYGEKPEDYLTDVLARKAVDFIQRAAQDPAPFFMYIAPYAPHSPAIPAPRHAELFPDLQAPRTLSFNEEDIYDKPLPLRKDPLRGKDLQEIDQLYRRRVQAMQAVDEMIGQVIQTLEQTGRLERTYIFFTSDNGFHMGQHRLAPGKTRAYEEDIRVPFIVRGPGIPKGATLSGYLAGNVDIAPTFAQLAGANVPDFIEGRSLVPLLFNAPPAKETWRQVYFIEGYLEEPEDTGWLTPYLEPALGGTILWVFHIPPALDSNDDSPIYGALRTTRYKYVEYVKGYQELYDLTKDPDELENLVDTADTALVEQLSSWAHRLYACTGAACRSIEQETAP